MCQKFVFFFLLGKTFNACPFDLEYVIRNQIYDIDKVLVGITEDTANSKDLCRDLVKSSAGIEPDFIELPYDQRESLELFRNQFKDFYEKNYKVILHSEGGLNYHKDSALIALNEISKGDCIVCNATKEFDDLIDVSNTEELPLRVVKKYENSDIKSVKEILKDQKVSWKTCSKKDVKDDFLVFCKKNKIELPVQYLSNVRINNFDFDLIWNDGTNRLNYMLCLNKASYISTTGISSVDLKNLPSEERKSVESLRENMKLQVVSYGKFAVAKDENNLMSDKKCYGIFASKLDKEKFDCDVKTKGKGIGFGSFSSISKNAIRLSRLKKEIKKIFSSNNAVMSFSRKNITVYSDTLITIYSSRNEVPALNLIEHYKNRVKHVILCHTNDGETIESLKKVKTIFSPENGYPEIASFPSDITLSNLLVNLKPENNDISNIIVNTTPGTKGMGSMLGIWAFKYGFNIWSMKQAESLLTCLNNNEVPSEPYLGIDLISLPKLIVDGQRPTVNEWNTEEKNFIKILIKILFKLKQENKDWSPATKKVEVFLDDGVYVLENDRCYKITKPNGKIVRFPSNGFSKTLKGDLIEALATVALENAGAMYVHSRIKLPYKKNTQEHQDNRLRDQNPNAKAEDLKAARREIDVIATWKSHHISVECKAQNYGPVSYKGGKTISVEDLALTVDSQGSPFTNLTISFLVLSDKTDANGEVHEYIDPIASKAKRVYVLDWKDLCDKDITAEIIDRGTSEKSSTIKKPTSPIR